MPRTLAQVEQEHARLQTALNSVPANKADARNKIVGDMRKLETEHKILKSGGKKKPKQTSMVTYLVVGAICVILISFAVAYFAGSKL